MLNILEGYDLAKDGPRSALTVHRITEAMRRAFIESLRRVVKGDLSVPAFIEHAKESFTYHFDTADMVYIHWLQAIEQFEIEALISNGEIAALGQRVAKIASEVGVLEIGLVERSRRQQDGARSIAIVRREVA